MVHRNFLHYRALACKSLLTVLVIRKERMKNKKSRLFIAIGLFIRSVTGALSRVWGCLRCRARKQLCNFVFSKFTAVEGKIYTMEFMVNHSIFYGSLAQEPRWCGLAARRDTMLYSSATNSLQSGGALIPC